MCAFSAFALATVLPNVAAADSPTPLPSHPDNPYRSNRAYGSLYVFEVSTGAVLFEDNADEKRAPASVVKMMTLLLLLEALDKGEVSLNDVITVPWQSSKIGGSGVGLNNKEQLSVEDAAKALIISSGNDAAIAIAEHLAGSEVIFAHRMNQRAKQLGMVDTYYRNAHGLDGWGPGSMTTAHDQSRLVRALLEHEETLRWTSVRSMQIRGGQTIHSTNKLLGQFPGLDGLKTGYTGKAGFCLASTAERDGMRVGCVLLGSRSGADRFDETKWALTEAFLRFRVDTPVRRGEVVGPPIPLRGSDPAALTAVADEDLPVVRNRDATDDLKLVLQPYSGLKPPIAAGTEIAHIEVLEGGVVVTRGRGLAAESAVRLNWWQRMRRWFER